MPFEIKYKIAINTMYNVVIQYNIYYIFYGIVLSNKMLCSLVRSPVGARNWNRMNRMISIVTNKREELFSFLITRHT
jgi:hypothetical protein